MQPLGKGEMIPDEDKLPNKEERAKMKAEQDKNETDAKELKRLCKEFIDEKIVILDMPASVIVDAVPELTKAILKVYTAKTKQHQAYLDAKHTYEDTSFKDLIKLES